MDDLAHLVEPAERLAGGKTTDGESLLIRVGGVQLAKDLQRLGVVVVVLVRFGEVVAQLLYRVGDRLLGVG